MWIGYGDESGFAGSVKSKRQPFLVVVSILVNTYGMHKTAEELGYIKWILKGAGISLAELKGSEIYNGTGAWSKVKDRTQRHAVYEKILKWLAGRSHKIAVASVDNNEFAERLENGDGTAKELVAPYVAACLQIALSVQIEQQKQKKNKGKTFLIFDEQEMFDKKACDLIYSPPVWTDSFYGYKKGLRLDQILDTVYFVRSHQASFIQVADLVAFVARRLAELTECDSKRGFDGEEEQLKRWWSMIKKRLLTKPTRFPSSGGKYSAFFKELTPKFLRQ